MIFNIIYLQLTTKLKTTITTHCLLLQKALYKSISIRRIKKNKKARGEKILKCFLKRLIYKLSFPV